MPYRVKQVDLAIDADEEANVAQCIDARWLTEGPKCKEFRAKLQQLIGARHVFFAPNGTLALFLACLALDPEPGDEIVVPTFTFYGSAAAAVYAGFKLVFVDADPHTFCATPRAFEAAIGPRTRAIMPVHIYGQCSDMEGIMAVARAKGVKVIEDAAQTLTVRLNGKHSGTFGDIGTFSLYSDKVITTGEGGIIVTDSEDLADRLRLIRNQGRLNSGTFVHPSLGMNFRITDLQAAIGLAQMQKLPDILKDRAKKWRLYSEKLAGIGDLEFMHVLKGSDIVPFRFPILTRDRDGLMHTLESAGIQTRGFFYPMHLQPKLKSDPPTCLPVAESLNARGICLPVHVHVADSQITEIVDVIRKHFGA
jgi:perosamine synthetase